MREAARPGSPPHATHNPTPQIYTAPAIMPCYYPIGAYQQAPNARVELYARDQRDLFLSRLGKHFTVPCGKCSGCRRTQALNFATRCMHEASQHRYNSYITLTYDEKNLPDDLSLHHEHFVTFMKALRNALARGNRNFRATLLHGMLDGTDTDAFVRYAKHRTQHLTNARNTRILTPYTEQSAQLETANLEENPANSQTVTSDALEVETKDGSTPASHAGVRFYMGGEYGTIYGRPHYHALLFGVGFLDRKYHGRTKSGAKIYTSETLSRLWPRGYSSIGDVTFASAAYIARYVMKKRTGDGNKDTYEIIDPETGEIYFKKKEYNQMSRHPGLGKTWFQKYHDDYIHADKIRLIDGREVKPPRYYDKQLKRLDREIYEHTKHARELEQLAHAHDNTPERLAVREIVDNAKARLQTRNLE